MPTIPPNNTSGLYGIDGSSVPIDNNILANNISATGNVTVDGFLLVDGSITTNSNFVGNLVGNVLGNIILSGSNTQVIFNDSGITGGSNAFTFNKATNSLAVTGTISATGNITGDYILGNGSQLTGLPQQYGDSNVVTLLAAFGSNTVSTTGNITGGYILGNGSQLTGLPQQYGNANVSDYLASGNNTQNIVTTGTVQGAKLQTSGGPGNIIGADYISANYFVGDGSYLTNINAGNIVGSYGNANVANFLTNFGSNSISTTGNVTAGYFFGNGSQLTGIATAIQGNLAGNLVGNGFGIANVAFISGDGSQLSNITGANVTGTVANATYALSANAATFAGTVTANAQPNITSVGNLTSLTVTGNSTLGNITIVGSKTIDAGNNIIGNAATPLANSDVATKGYVDSQVSSTAFDITDGVTTESVVSGDTITFSGVTNETTVVVSAPDTVTIGLPNDVTITGNLAANAITSTTTISATGNVTAGNISSNGQLTATGNLQAANLTITNNANITNDLTVGGTIYGTFSGNISGNLVVPGANTDIIYNNSGNAGASSDFTYNDSTKVMFLDGTANITGNVLAGNVTTTGQVSATGNITGNHIIGNGSALTSLNGANVTGTVANATYALSANSATFAGTVTTNAQPNITSVGNLTSLTVTGDSLMQGNLTVNGNVTYINSNTVTINDKFINVANNAATSSQANGGGIGVGPAGAEYATWSFSDANTAWQSNIKIEAPAVTTTGNITGAYIIGNGSLLTSITGANVTGPVANAAYSDLASYVTSNAQGNITSVGTLTSLSVSGNTTSGNIISNGVVTATGNITGAYIIGNGSALTSLTGANVTGTVANATYADTAGLASYVTGNAQGNITSVGTLTSLSVSGNTTSGNLLTGGLISATGNITSSGNISGGNILSTGQISTTGNVTGGNVIGTYLWGDGSNITGVVAGSASTQIPIKNTSGGTIAEGTPVYATGTVGASTTLEIAPSLANTAATMPCVGLTTTSLGINAQGYAISVGTLKNVNTSTYSVGQVLYVAPGGGLTSTRPNDGYLVQPVGTVGRVGTGDGSIDTNIWNYFQLPNLGSGNIWLGNANSIPIETTLATYTGNIGAGNLSVSGNIAAGNISITGVYSGNGSALTSLTGANVTGTVANATYADTAGLASFVTGNAQGNITSVGTLTSLSVTGNTTSGNLITGGLLTVTGNVTAGNIDTAGIVTASNITANLQFANIITNNQQIQTTQARNPAAVSATVADPGRIVIGTGYNGNLSPGNDLNSTGRGSRLLVSDAISVSDLQQRFIGIGAQQYITATANVTSTNTRVLGISGQLAIGGGASGNTWNTASGQPLTVVGTNGAVTVGGGTSGNLTGLGNTTLGGAAGMSGAVVVNAGSQVNNAFGSQGVLAAFGGNVGNAIGLATQMAYTGGSYTGNVIAFYHAGSTNNFGFTTANQARQASGYYFLRNDDDVAQNKMGSMLTWHDFRYTHTTTTGAITVDKNNGQTQYIAVTGNITGITLSNFVTTASDGANTDQEMDTVTLWLRQDATGRTITMPTGANYFYTAGNTTVSTTANSVSKIEFTAIDNTGTTQYLIDISAEYTST